jgi:hypothetical protein
MQREQVTFAFPAPRPTDWASTMCLLPIAQQWAKVWRIEDFKVGCLADKHDRHAKEMTGRTPAHLSAGNTVTVLIEGWAEKE